MQEKQTMEQTFTLCFDGQIEDQFAQTVAVCAEVINDDKLNTPIIRESYKIHSYGYPPNQIG